MFLLLPSEFQAALAGAFGQRLNASVVDIAAAVEHHGVNPLLQGALGNLQAYLLRGFLIAAESFKVLLDAGGRAKRVAGDVVNDLSINILIAAENAQTRPLRRSGDLGADSGVELGALSSSIRSFNHSGTPSLITHRSCLL